MTNEKTKRRAVPLTAKVIRGLRAAKAAIEADPVGVLVAQEDEASCDAEQLHTLSDWDAALKWIEDQQARRGM